MKQMNYESTRSFNGGKVMNCRFCGARVGGGFWTKYGHCVKHSFNVVKTAGEMVLLCFGLAAL